MMMISTNSARWGGDREFDDDGRRTVRVGVEI